MSYDDRRSLAGAHEVDAESRCPVCLEPIGRLATEVAADGAVVHRECVPQDT